MAAVKNILDENELIQELSREFLNSEVKPVILSQERVLEIKRLRREKEIRGWLLNRRKLAQAG